MRVRTALALFISAALAVLAAEATRAEDHKRANINPALDQFKQLAGTWSGKAIPSPEAGQALHAKYRVTSAGSAVVEVLFPDTEHEMVTVIHPDGDDLALTHYCALGNQPHLKSRGKSEGNKVTFKFVSGSNMKSGNDPHMHEVTYTFVDKDTLKSEWTHYDNGKATGAAVFEFKRDK